MNNCLRLTRNLTKRFLSTQTNIKEVPAASESNTNIFELSLFLNRL